MKKTDTATVLEFLSLTDNRKITEDRILAWHDAIGHLDFEIARSAVTEAVRDDSISWVEPKHILAKARLVLERLEVEKRREQPLPERKLGDAMPVCEHGLGLLYCLPCCRARVRK